MNQRQNAGMEFQRLEKPVMTGMLKSMMNAIMPAKKPLAAMESFSHKMAIMRMKPAIWEP
jgi:hypothetical protein